MTENTLQTVQKRQHGFTLRCVTPGSFRRARGNICMTKILRDVPIHEGMTVADRLKAARKDANKTRKAVFESTGIPASTLEKYETGNMDPNTTRLQAICDFLGVSVGWVLNGHDTLSVAATEKPAETQVSANVAETSTETFTESTPEHSKIGPPTNENDPMGHIQEVLSSLDTMRAYGFVGYQRQAIALEEYIRTALKSIEPKELTTLALEQGLFQDESFPKASDIHDLFAEGLDEGQASCGCIEERILDTVILGVDLFKIDRGPLVELADKLQEVHDIAAPAWGGFSWGDHKDFVPLIRPYLRALAYRGNFVDFSNEDLYKKREP